MTILGYSSLIVLHVYAYTLQLKQKQGFFFLRNLSLKSFILPYQIMLHNSVIKVLLLIKVNEYICS